MTKRKPPSRAARLKKARAEAAAVLGLPDSDLHVKRYALLSVEYDNLTARYLSGDRLDVSELTRLESSMQEIKATLPPPTQTVDLNIVRSIICPKCRDMRPMTAEEQSQKPSPPVAKAVSDAGNNNHRSTASATSLEGKSKPKVEPPKYHETMQRDSRPNPSASINGGGSAVWWTGTNNRGAL